MNKCISIMAAAIAALSLSGCTQEEELFVSDNSYDSINDSNLVRFGAYTGRAPQTRASALDAKSLKTEGFGVFAYYTDTEDFDITGDNKVTPNFMCNQQVIGKNSANVSANDGESVDFGDWTYSPAKYWPNITDTKLSFFAYAPYIDEPVGKGEAGITSLPHNDSTGDPKIGYTIPEEPGEQLDLLYSGSMLNLLKENIDQKVTFDFNHAMTRIGFERVIETDQVDLDNNGKHDNEGNAKFNIADGTTVTITKVSLYSPEFYKSGELNLRTGKWDKLSKAAQTYTLTEDDFTNDGMNATSENSSIKTMLNNEDSYLMIFPTGKENKIPLEITIEYNVTTIDKSLPDGKSQITSIVTTPFEFAFEEGKYYNFVLRIGLTSTKLDVKTEDWSKNWSGSTDTEIVVNTPYNNTVTLIYDANRGKFANGSSQYIITSHVNNWIKEEGDKSGENDPSDTAKFIVEKFQNSDLTPSDLDRARYSYFGGWTEEQTEEPLTPTALSMKGYNVYHGGEPIFVKQTETSASRTLYALWSLYEIID